MSEEFEQPPFWDSDRIHRTLEDDNWSFVWSQAKATLYIGAMYAYADVCEHLRLPIARGYSGRGEGLNNPAFEGVSGTGPLPKGRYGLKEAIRHSKLGPLTLRLIPYIENEMHGRSGFAIHGDNAKGNQSASEGCIVLRREVREFLNLHRSRDFYVVP